MRSSIVLCESREPGRTNVETEKVKGLSRKRLRNLDKRLLKSKEYPQKMQSQLQNNKNGLVKAGKV